MPLLETVLDLARRHDATAITELRAALGTAQRTDVNFGIDIFGTHPIQLLAKEGNIAAVEWLIKYFNGSKDQAAQGYAYGGYIQEVNDMLEQGVTDKKIIAINYQ